ncbi:hypothetical protein [Halorarius litoreus]|uniref:DUF7860 family protein n=1 Tax=Halorarius litoreus TaxID=2962676 RepID=UPI0020CC248C|nr:hypothetical protein [Halorarius litoreus]
MGRYGNLNYPKLTRNGFLLGLALLVLSMGTELLAHGLHYTLPAWEETLLFDVGILGLFLFLLSPIVFGIVLPLTE